MSQQGTTQARPEFTDCARNYEYETRELAHVEVSQAIATKVSHLLTAEGDLTAMGEGLQQPIDSGDSTETKLQQVEANAEQKHVRLQKETQQHSKQMATKLQNAGTMLSTLEGKPCKQTVASWKKLYSISNHSSNSKRHLCKQKTANHASKRSSYG